MLSAVVPYWNSLRTNLNRTLLAGVPKARAISGSCLVETLKFFFFFSNEAHRDSLNYIWFDLGKDNWSLH